MTGNTVAASDGPRVARMSRQEGRVVVRDCLALALAFFVANHVGIVAGWVMLPAGYEPLWLAKGGDVAIYLSWIEAFRTSWLIPNYHAPWHTEPAYFNPIFFGLARVTSLTGAPVAVAYHALHLITVLFCGYALARCLTVFTDSLVQARVAVAMMLCSIPLAALGATAAFFGGEPSGIDAFLNIGFDSFFHGIPGAPTTAAGTGFALLSFALLGEHLRGGAMWPAVAATAVGAFLHPFEVVLVVAAGGVVLLARRDVRGAALLALGGVLGLTPWILQFLASEWVRSASGGHVFEPGSILLVLSSLGIPTLLALLTLRPSLDGTDGLLRAWVIGVLVLVYVPLVPWSQHLFDGYHYAVGMLATRQIWTRPLAARPGVRRLGVALLGISLLAYPAYWRQALVVANENGADLVNPTVRTLAERDLVAWFRDNADPNDLVIAPQRLAPWIAGAPTHVVGSHWMLSLSYEEQTAFLDRFYAGDTSGLERWGARFVVTEGSAAPAPGYGLAANVGPWTVWANPAARMPEGPTPAR